jgi:hypothetical protein
MGLNRMSGYSCPRRVAEPIKCVDRSFYRGKGRFLLHDGLDICSWVESGGSLGREHKWRS